MPALPLQSIERADGDGRGVGLAVMPDAQKQKQHISEMPWTVRNWYQHIDWLNTHTILTLPLIGIFLAPFTPLRTPTAICAIAFYFMTGLGVTAGYHRLWAHRSYGATFALRIWLAAMGGAAAENSIRRWARDHRAHHRYTDTEKDPYSAGKGLIYSHMGWLVLKHNPRDFGRTDIADLNSDPVVVWQHKNYVLVVLVFGFLIPCSVCGLGWGDWMGGLVYASILRILFVHQATFCVNSVAHWLGDQPFDDRDTPRDHAITAYLTLGEGYHNFHHQFPSDYRNAVAWHQYDPTKWTIWLWKQMGLAHDLKTFRTNEIEKSRVQQEQKKLDLRRAQVEWIDSLDMLPVIDWTEFQRQVDAGSSLIVIAGMIHDVESFVQSHPGGRAMIKSGIGKDATAMFYGGVYSHSKDAQNFLSTLRVGIMFGGCEVEIWKQQPHAAEEKDGTEKEPPGQ